MGRLVEMWVGLSNRPTFVENVYPRILVGFREIWSGIRMTIKLSLPFPSGESLRTLRISGHPERFQKGSGRN